MKKKQVANSINDEDNNMASVYEAMDYQFEPCR